MIDRLASAIRSALTRSHVTDTRMGPRTLLQVTGLDGETIQGVELLLPPGYTARPAAGADVTLHQVMGSRDHLVALGGDAAGQAQPDLQPGEFGLRHASGATLIFRADHVELTTPAFLKITAAQYVEIDAPLLRVSGDIVDNFQAQTETMAGQRAVYDVHTHPVPNVQTGGGTATTSVPTQQEV